MVRLVLILLLVIAGVLVVALLRDQRGRRGERIDRLRWAFLHGTPLAGYSRGGALEEYAHRGGMRFRIPASWIVETEERSPPAAAPSSGRRLRVEVHQLEGPPGGGTDGVVQALKGLKPEGEQSIEVLANGNVLMKTVDATRSEGVEQVVYSWRLGRAVPPGGARIAVFRLSLPVETAPDVIAQSDLATVDREVRSATFAEEPSGPSVG
jgi:hypothetical protein